MGSLSKVSLAKTGYGSLATMPGRRTQSDAFCALSEGEAMVEAIVLGPDAPESEVDVSMGGCRSYGCMAGLAGEYEGLWEMEYGLCCVG